MARYGFSIIGSLLFALLFLSPMVLADQEQLLELARDIPDDKLHAALHDYNDGKFKHVLLAKRQSTNTTMTTSTRPTSVTSISSSSSSSSRAADETSTSPTGTGGGSNVTPTTSSTTSDRTESTPPPVTSPPTSTRATSSWTTKTTRTITYDDGQRSTVTEVTVVVPQATEEPSSTNTNTNPATATSTGAASMQGTNGASGLKVRGIEAAGAAGIAAMVFFML